MEQPRTNAFVFESGETLSVTVAWYRISPVTTLGQATLERVEKDGTCSETLSRHFLNVTPYLFSDDTLLVVPLVRLCTGSSATLGLYEPQALNWL